MDCKYWKELDLEHMEIEYCRRFDKRCYCVGQLEECDFVFDLEKVKAKD